VIQSLENISLIEDMSAVEKVELAKKCSWRSYQSGEQVLERSSDSRDVFFVVEGRVDIVNYGLSGREVAYATVEAGQYFGELSAVDGQPRSANVNAGSKCLLASLSPENFQQLLLSNSRIMMSVLLRLARIIRTSDDRILDLSTLGAVQRVCQELLRMAEPDPVTPDSWLIYPMPTQSTIAGRVSTTRETVARVLGFLAHENMVLKKGKNLYLKDKDAIKTYMNSLSSSSSQHVAR
jgi:CRP/FNR family transcriptional regulator, cyclic AMP receptor protein